MGYWDFADFPPQNGPDSPPVPFVDETIAGWKKEGCWSQHSAFQSKVAELMGLRSLNKWETVLSGLLWGYAIPLDSTSYGSSGCPDCKTLVMYRTQSFDATSNTDHVLVIINFGGVTMETYGVDFHTQSGRLSDSDYVTTALDGEWEVKFNGDASPGGTVDVKGVYGYNDACTDVEFQKVIVENGRTTV